MDRIMVYIEPAGKTTVRLPKYSIPDRATVERLADVIREHRKSPAQSGNSERDKAYAPADQEDCTTPSAERQEGRRQE